VYSPSAKKWVTVIDGDANPPVKGGQKFSLKDFRPEGPPPKKLSKRAYGRFNAWVKIPLERGLRLAKQTGNPVLAVLLVLDRAIFENGGRNPVVLTNALLRQYGISHQSKTRGLRRLEAAGVVSVEWNRDRKVAPIVTHRWYPA